MSSFVFNSENFQDPQLPAGLRILELVPEQATEESLTGFGRLVHDIDDFTTDKKTFEIVKWPVSGWRQLDPDSKIRAASYFCFAAILFICNTMTFGYCVAGDEAGTTEGDFDVTWQGDYYIGKNLAIATTNNTYLDGLGKLPEFASRDEREGSTGESIMLWMSDYHPGSDLVHVLN